MPVGLTRTEYAAHRKRHGLGGHTLKSIRQAIDRGACPTLPDGSIDPMAADKAWRAWHVNNVSTPADEAASSTRGPDYAVERARREAAMASLAELKLAQARGDSVDAQTAARDWYAAARTARDLLLGIPTECAAELASMRDAHAVEMLLMARITAALESLSSPPSGESDDDGDLEEDDTDEAEAG